MILRSEKGKMEAMWGRNWWMTMNGFRRLIEFSFASTGISIQTKLPKINSCTYIIEKVQLITEEKTRQDPAEDEHFQN